MWRKSLPLLLLHHLVLAPLSAATGAQPFQPIETAAVAAVDLFRRQSGGCISNFYSCSSQGSAFANTCCANGQLCVLDASSQPACCPAGAVCTGTAPSTFVTPTAGAVSYVSNTYFPFPYIATSFPNSAACTSAASQCSANFAACTSDLGGQAGSGGYAVTIDVPGGGGTTVAATAVNVGTVSASSICNSLSSVACHGLQSSQCSQFSATGTGFVVGGSSNVARPTAMPCVGVVGAVAAGVGLGVMGIDL